MSKSVFKSALKYEINTGAGLEQMAAILGFTQYFHWDKALDWLEDETRTEDEIKDVLIKLGYDIKG